MNVVYVDVLREVRSGESLGLAKDDYVWISSLRARFYKNASGMLFSSKRFCKHLELFLKNRQLKSFNGEPAEDKQEVYDSTRH